MAEIHEIWRNFADPSPGFGDESPMRLQKDEFKALFAASGQLWRTPADRFVATRQSGVKSSPFLQIARPIRMVRSWGSDWLATDLLGLSELSVGNFRYA